MRRILELGTLLLLLTTLLTPVSEMLDRWDAPGLANDVEMHLFALVLILALVLLVARMVSLVRQLLISLTDHGRVPALRHCGLRAGSVVSAGLLSRGPVLCPPLRI